MLQLTKRTEYGLIALLYLADQGGRFVSAREVSDHYPVPPRLLAEVLKDLCKQGLVESQRGAAGGYQLVGSPDQLSLGRIVQALEGPVALTGCEPMAAFKNGSCDVTPVCPIKDPMQRIRSLFWSLLVKTSLADLAAGAPLGGVPHDRAPLGGVPLDAPSDLNFASLSATSTSPTALDTTGAERSR